MNAYQGSTSQLIALYVVALLVLGVLDGAWLGWLAKDFYRAEMGPLMADPPAMLPAAIFYFAFPIGLVFFALAPLWASGDASLAQAFFRSAALGLVAYATYDLTNMSVINGFSVRLALLDMVWGTFASGTAGAVAFGVARWWSQRA